MLFEPITLVLASLPIVIIVYAVFKKDKTVGALVQLGGLQSRMADQEALSTSKELRTTKMTLVDKVTFTLGVVNVAATPYILGRAPQLFYFFYTPKAVLLLAVRYYDFLKKKKQWLLMDFCYWANFLLLYYIWFDPTNAALFQVCFIVANGPLAWSMLAFSHSLIFHSYPHVTSVFIHASPALLTFGLRWHSTPEDGFVVCAPEHGAGAIYEAGAACDVPSVTLLWQALVGFYVWWISLYYIFVFLLLGDYIHKKGFQTLYNRVVSSGPLKSILAMAGAWLYPKVGGTATALAKRGVYMAAHLAYGVLSMSLAAVYWRTQWGHLAFLVTILTSTAWNGANHYFTAFSRQGDQHIQAAAKSHGAQSEPEVPAVGAGSKKAE